VSVGFATIEEIEELIPLPSCAAHLAAVAIARDGGTSIALQFTCKPSSKP
jgi:hypothetical protein